MSFSSMMGGLSSLSLSRSHTDDRERGRSKAKDAEKSRARSSSVASRPDPDAASLRSRSTSPFRLRRHRTNRTRDRDPSPAVSALAQQSDYESDSESIRPSGTAYLSDDESLNDDPTANADSDSSPSDNDDPDADQFDPVTEANTERNALVVPPDLPDVDVLELPDPLGEGPNVVVPPEPYFPTTLNHTSDLRNPRRRKSLRHEPMPLNTSRPVFQRDRCTITITQGDPEKALKESGRRSRRYVVASDMSDESRYAVEWAIGTVLKDGDELCVDSFSHLCTF